MGRTRAPRPAPSELAVERLVQEGLLQFLQGGEFAFVEAGEVLGFYLKKSNRLFNLLMY